MATKVAIGHQMFVHELDRHDPLEAVRTVEPGHVHRRRATGAEQRAHDVATERLRQAAAAQPIAGGAAASRLSGRRDSSWIAVLEDEPRAIRSVPLGGRERQLGRRRERGARFEDDQRERIAAGPAIGCRAAVTLNVTSPLEVLARTLA